MPSHSHLEQYFWENLCINLMLWVVDVVDVQTKFCLYLCPIGQLSRWNIMHYIIFIIVLFLVFLAMNDATNENMMHGVVIHLALG